MKNVITIIAIIAATSLFGQDYKLFIEINKYRQSNGLNVLIFDQNSHNDIKTKVNKSLKTEKSIYWTKNNEYPIDSTEFMFFLKNNDVKVKDFSNFLLAYYNIKMKINNKSDVEKYMLYYIVFDIDRNQKTKKQVLDTSITRGSVNIIYNTICICYGFEFN